MIPRTSSTSIILETRKFLSRQIGRVETNSERDDLRLVMKLLGDIAEKWNDRDSTIDQFWLSLVKKVNAEIKEETK